MSSTDFTSTDLHADTLAALKLSLIPQVGPLLQQSLLDHFGSAQGVLEAAPNQLRQVSGIGSTLALSIAKWASSVDVEDEIRVCRENQIHIVPRHDVRYPRYLQEIPDPPAVLFLQGELLPQDTLSIAIVGTRHATHYGKRQATRIASTLAHAGLTIVSGLARGIDAAAHQGALEANGRTIAVLPAGLTNLYPSEHKELAFDITRQGALVSESPSRTPISRGAFPRRNRIITGISLGTIVIEAGERSGALVSARHAMEQGREVFALPGPVDSRVSHGCHQLIRDGAKLVQSAEDVLEELGPLVESTTAADGMEVHHPGELLLNDQEKMVLDHIGSASTSIECLLEVTAIPIPRLLATLSALEIRRLIRRISGNAVVRL